MLTVKQAFDQLNSNLALTNAHEAEISRRKDSVTECVAKSFEVKRTFIAGSFRRNTAILPMSGVDVDVFIVLNPKHRDSSPVKVLDRLRSALAFQYSTVKVSRNGEAVTIRFPDFGIDAVPCFDRPTGGIEIPGSREEQWIATDPEKHATHLAEQHQKHDQALIPLIRMIKGWNRNINNAFTGFYLELLTMHVLQGITITCYPSAIATIFDKGREAAACYMNDPAGLGAKVAGFGALTTVAERKAAFEIAFGRAARALEHDASGTTGAALESWRSIFSSYFPANA